MRLLSREAPPPDPGYTVRWAAARSLFDNFILILLELRARHRQSGCVIGCRALASVGTTCLLHKIPCTPGLAKRSGSPPICSLR